MEPQLTTQDSLVLPTGATTGERIEINVNDSGLINIYNSSNQLVATLGGADGSVYVTDGSTTFVKLVNGQVEVGGFSGGSPDFAEAGALFFDPVQSFGDIRLISGKNTASSLTDQILLDMFPGAAGIQAPQFVFMSKSGTEPINGVFGGPVASGSNAGVANQLEPLTYNTGWADGSTFNGSTNWGPLRLRKLPDDTVHVSGAVIASTGAGAAIGHVLAGWVPVHQQPLIAQRNNGGTVSTGFAAITAAGNLDIITNTGLAVAAGNEYLIEGTYRLDTIL